MMNFVKTVNIVILVICTLLSVSFIVTILAGLPNHGNIIGLIVCLIVIAAIVLYPVYKEIGVIRILFNVVGVVFLLSALYTAIVSAFMVSGALNNPEKPLEAGTEGAYAPYTVVVLGCQTIDGEPSLMLKSRLDKAIEYLNENPSAVCIVTGGQGDDETEPEAETMARYLITNGISENIIYKEDKSRNTQQNLSYAKLIIDSENLPEDVIIISECYHVYRGTRQAKSLGLNACAIPADIDTQTVFSLPSFWLREVFALSRDFVADIF